MAIWKYVCKFLRFQLLGPNILLKQTKIVYTIIYIGPKLII